MTRTPLILLATAGLLALASCGPRDASTGELDNGRFSYRCVDSSDAVCDDFVGAASMPELFAVGGAFDLEYAGDTSDSSPVRVEPASEKMLSSASGHFKLLLPGVSAALARNTSGVVSDFIHLRGAGIDHLDVAGPSSTQAITEVQMTTDKEIDLLVAPKDELGTKLAGALPYAWSNSDSTVVALDTTLKKNRVTLTAFKPGTATVEVSLPSGVKMAVLVTVKKGTSSSSSSSGGGASSSSSTGSSSGAGGAGGGQ